MTPGVPESYVDTFIQLTVDALTLGSVYALIALGYALVYGVAQAPELRARRRLHGRHVHRLRHAERVRQGLSMPEGAGLAAPSGRDASRRWLARCLGVTIERFAYRPLRDAPRIAPLISALGVSFFFANSMQLLFGAQPRNYDAFAFNNRALYLRGHAIGDVKVPSSCASSRWLGVRADDRPVVPRQPHEDPARPMRATSFDREAAAMMGVNMSR